MACAWVRHAPSKPANPRALSSGPIASQVLQAQMTIDEALLAKPNDDDDDWEPPPVKYTWLEDLDENIFHTPFAKYTAALCV